MLHPQHDFVVEWMGVGMFLYNCRFLGHSRAQVNSKAHALQDVNFFKQLRGMISDAEMSSATWSHWWSQLRFHRVSKHGRQTSLFFKTVLATQFSTGRVKYCRASNTSRSARAHACVRAGVRASVRATRASVWVSCR
eukprot:1213801-Amphidinium_carterae.1